MVVELAVVAALADAASVPSVVAAFVALVVAAAASVRLVVAEARPAAVVEEQFDTELPVAAFVAAVVVAAADDVLVELASVLVEFFSSSYQCCALAAVASVSAWMRRCIH